MVFFNEEECRKVEFLEEVEVFIGDFINKEIFERVWVESVFYVVLVFDDDLKLVFVIFCVKSIFGVKVFVEVLSVDSIDLLK